MSDTFSSIGEAASQAANDVLLSQTSSFLTWVKGLLTWEHLFKLIIHVSRGTLVNIKNKVEIYIKKYYNLFVQRI